MSKEEISAFWKTWIILDSIPQETLEKELPTNEGLQTLIKQFNRLKAAYDTLFVETNIYWLGAAYDKLVVEK